MVTKLYRAITYDTSWRNDVNFERRKFQDEMFCGL